MAINNTVILIGNMGSEARITESKEGKTFAALSLATKDSYQDEQGEWQEKETIWHNVLVFSPIAIEVLKSLKVGTRIKITGNLSYRPFEVMIEGKPVTKKEASVIATKIEQAPLAKKTHKSTE